MEKYISVVIPNYNNAGTIGKCLEAAFSSDYRNFEVIVVDDGSTDDSVDLIKRFPCRLIRLERRYGASKARNTGARHSRGEVIFFTDADCLLQHDTLSIINRTLVSLPPSIANWDKEKVVIGGTYARTPYDEGFFSSFQAVFVHYFETKKTENPDYVAAHAMIISPEAFKKNKGFPETFLPIIEDVEFCHRLRREGYGFLVNPAIQVRHIFNFSLLGSMRNAVRKTMYWTIYSLKNRDSFYDSGTASTELKVNVASFILCAAFAGLFLFSGKLSLLFMLPPAVLLNIIINRKYLMFIRGTGGPLFATSASLYYVTLYAAAVGTGAFFGTVLYFLKGRKRLFG